MPKMNEEFSDRDVMKTELPEYEENSFPFPDVPTESSFAENKDEIFRRNIIMAAKEAKLSGLREMYPENFGTEEIFPRGKASGRNKKPERGGFLRSAAAFLDRSYNLKILYSILLLVFVIITVILLSITFQLRGRLKNTVPQTVMQVETVIQAEPAVQAETGLVVTIPAQDEEIMPVTEILSEQVTEVIPETAASVTYAAESILS